MDSASPRGRLAVAFGLAALVGLLGTACGGGAKPLPKMPAPGTVDADQFLFDRGNADMARKHYIEAGEYFRKLVDGYPQSTRRSDGKLGLGDSFLAQKRLETDILAIAQYREFLEYYPTSARADYAQYQICVAQSHEILGPERDQTATVETIKQTTLFLDRYPSSAYRPQVTALDRQARDRQSEHEFLVGLYYFRVKLWGGASDRFQYLLAHDPDYTNRDVVYYYLAESFMNVKLEPAALPLYQKVVDEFPKSKYVEASKKRIAEFKR